MKGERIMNQQLKEAANMLNQAYDKFNLVEPEAQDALWHEIQSIKHKIDLLIKQAGAATPAVKRA